MATVQKDRGPLSRDKPGTAKERGGGKDRSLFGGTRGEKAAEPNRANLDKEIADEVEKAEKDLDELRATYELFFMGVERSEPTNQRDLLKATIRRWQERKPRNTGLRFRIQQLKARMVSLENYWARIHREREAGTYHRDLAKAKRRELELARQQAKAQAAAPPQPAASAAAPSAAARPAAARASAGPAAGPTSDGAPRPRIASAEDLTEVHMRRLHQTFITARRRCGEPADLRYEDMASALKRQVPKLMSETGARSVEFKVVIRGGKAVLKALPKHED